LAAVFDGESEKVADGEMDERTDVVTSMAENSIVVDFSLELY